MKRKSAVLLIVMFAIAVQLCGCSAALAPKNIQNVEKSVTYSVYVAGAVKNEGFYTIAQGSTVMDVITQAGILEQTILPENVNELINEDTEIFLSYLQNGAICFPINLNGAVITHKLSVAEIDFDVIERISDYVSANGKITNKNTLKLVLSDKYADNYYKFYVSAEDFETYY